MITLGRLPKSARVPFLDLAVQDDPYGRVSLLPLADFVSCHGCPPGWLSGTSIMPATQPRLVGR
jgi:hypothetical protein